jgi:pimeloyl-ACP methyl ester carboxylesterase
MPVSEVNGVELYWERSGSGLRLLYCNGSGQTLANSQPLRAPFAASFDLLAWDYRGFGQSGPVIGPYSMADVAADMAGLLELAGWDTCRMFGVSYGGMAAQEFAVTSPERVERLGLNCTSSGGAGGSSYSPQKLLELPEDERLAAGLKVADSRWDAAWLAAHPSDRELAEGLAGAMVGGSHQPDSPAADARKAQMQSRAGHDVWDRLDRITCPTLVAYGRYDGIAPQKNSEAIASRIRGSELRGYEGGHRFLLQDPVASADVVKFLQTPTR